MGLILWPLNLHSKYLLLSTIVFFALITYFTFDSISKQEKVITASFISKTEIITNLLNELAITNYLNIETLRILLKNIKAQHQITYAYFLDKEGRVLTDGTKENIYKYKFLDDDLSKLTPTIDKGIKVMSKNICDVLEPIDLGEDRLGALRMGFSFKLMKQEMRAMRKRNLLIGVGLLFFVSFINYLAASYIISPIKRLTELSYAIAKGNFNQKIDINRKDELGQLATAFNHMMLHIEKSNTDLIKAKEYTEQVIQAINSILLVTDCKGSMTFVNVAACDYLGYKENELLGQSIKTLQTTPLIFEKDQEIGYVSDIETLLQTKKGTTIPVWLQSSFLLEDKKEGSIIWVAQDLSKLEQVSKALDASRNYQSAMIKAVPDLMFIFSKEGTYLDFFLDDEHPEVEELRGKDIMEVKILPREVALDMKEKIKATAISGQIQTMEYTLPVPREETHYEARLTSIDGKRVLMLVRDITEHKKAEEALRYKALHDTLTGLANRANFSNMLQHALNLCKRNTDFIFAVLLLDLDGFKHVNDSLGHIAGDEMLCEMSRRLKRCVRQQDTVARLGGDEFAILLEGIDSIYDAILVAERIQQELNTPFFIGEQEIFSSVSIGITLNTFDYKEPSEILRDADIALYRAKDNGKAQYEIFDSILHQHAVNRLQVAGELRHAVRQNDFIPHYQPIIDLKSQRLVGFEALARWQRAKSHVECPDKFIGIAEEIQQTVEIDYIILDKACYQVASWQEKTGLDLTVSTNLSGHQFVRSDLVAKIRQVLKKSGLAGKSLRLEITEGVLLQNPELVSHILNEIKSLGVKIYLDDFGTGYSSLSYLHRFPIDTLKLDRSFIQNMKHSDDSYKIVQAIIAMAQNLGIEVVAEGIERKEHLEKLQNWGCNYGQGYFFSKPMDASQAHAFLTKASTPIQGKSFVNTRSSTIDSL